MTNLQKAQLYYIDMLRRKAIYLYSKYLHMRKAGATNPDKGFYLIFTALEDNSTVSLVSNIPTGKELAIQPHLQVSYDAVNWNEYVPGTILTIAKDSNVYFRAAPEGNERFADIRTAETTNGARNGIVLNNSFYYFLMTGKIAASGSIMALLDQNPLKALMKENPDIAKPNTTTGAFTFYGLFYNCTSLVKAPDLSATKLASHCYDCMFRGCTSLEEMPDLPATHLVPGCYMHMFNSCLSLVRTKKINATKVENAACYSMFLNCTSLEEANILDDCEFEYVDSYGLRYMFLNCTKLKTGPARIIINGKAGHATCANMFINCELTAAPDIHVESLQNRSGLYSGMFQGCTQLSAVPADYLKNSASVISSHLSAYDNRPKDPDDGAEAQSINIKEMYNGMFEGCTALTAAPFLYECALSTGGISAYEATKQYEGMFKNCTSLACISTDFTKYNANLKNLLQNVALTGVMYCKQVNDLSTTANRTLLGIPAGWSIEELP